MAVNLKLKPGQMMKVRSAVRKRMGRGLPVKIHLDDGSDRVNTEVKSANGAGFSSTMKKIGKSALKFAGPIAEKAAQKAIMGALGGGAKKGRKKGRKKGKGLHVGGSMLPVRGV